MNLGGSPRHDRARPPSLPPSLLSFRGLLLFPSTFLPLHFPKISLDGVVRLLLPPGVPPSLPPSLPQVLYSLWLYDICDLYLELIKPTMNETGEGGREGGREESVGLRPQKRFSEHRREGRREGGKEGRREGKRDTHLSSKLASSSCLD